MPGHDLVVVGASAGGVEALIGLVKRLPADLPAAVCVVVHVPADNPGVLPRILDRAGPLPAAHARDGEPLRPGRIYVAAPDRHLLVHEGHLRVVHGPRENNHRPAVDPLFRSAARAYGPRVVGVVLSGSLDDGTAGLHAVKRRGGVAVVQDPAEALFPGMPQHALANVAVDHVLPLADLAPLLVRLAHSEAPDPGVNDMADDMDLETHMAEMDPAALGGTGRLGPPSGFSCPDCGGSLFELHDGQLLRYRCRVGHAYSPESLAAGQSAAVEEALWVAFRALEERAALLRRMARRMQEAGVDRLQQRHEGQAEEIEQRAAVIRQLIEQGVSSPQGPPASPAEGAA
jgi:two-component system chemotaxis response regulator CheB